MESYYPWLVFGLILVVVVLIAVFFTLRIASAMSSSTSPVSLGGTTPKKDDTDEFYQRYWSSKIEPGDTVTWIEG